MDKKSLWLYAAKGVMMVAGVGTHFFFARLGGVEGYALLSLFLSLVLIFNNLADFGISLNGPRILADQAWPAFGPLAQWLRKRLAVLSSALYVGLIWWLYPNQAAALMWGLPMLLLFGFQADWKLRGSGKPQLAAYRQMAQSILQMGVLLVAYWFSSSAVTALGLYAAAAALTYVFSEWKWGQAPSPPAALKSVGGLLQLQLSVFTGFILQNLQYILAIPLLMWLTNAKEGGTYGSHFFLFTSLATLSVITMEVFMGKPQQERGRYGRWLVLFTALAMLGLLASKWYFPLLYGGKGFAWQSDLTTALVFLVWIHAARLYWVNRLLFIGRNQLFGRLNGLALVLQLACWALAKLLGMELNALRAVQFLMLAEVLMLAVQAVLPRPQLQREAAL
jgi:O-antigen/teichoic acid export membrane protein